MTTARLPLGAAARRVLRRALILYGVAIVIALGFAALGLLTDLRLWYDVQTELPRSRTSTLRFVLSVLTLHESFHDAQILVLYIVYLLITPLALLACADGKGWIVLVVSGLIYLISQVYPAAVALPFAAYFSPVAWQPLFFGGLVIGYYRVWIAQTRWWALICGFLAAGVVLVAAFFLVLYLADYSAWPALPDMLGLRETMASLRLLLVAVYLYAGYLIVTWFWTPLDRGFRWLVLPIGQASLWTFTTHFVVIVGIYNLPFFHEADSTFIGTLWHLAAIVVVWATIMLRNALRHGFLILNPGPLRQDTHVQCCKAMMRVRLLIMTLST